MKPFTDTLNALRYGTLSDDLTTQLAALVAACDSTGRPGEITLKLKLKPGKGGQIEIFDEVAVKLPKQDRASSLMFATPEGNLSRNDPRQLPLEGLRAVEQPEPGALRTISQGA